MRHKTETVHEDELSLLDKRLDRDEDDELRRLNYFEQVGSLSPRKKERFIELRLRDRRNEIRAPREFGEEQPYTAKQRRRFRLPFMRRS